MTADEQATCRMILDEVSRALAELRAVQSMLEDVAKRAHRLANLYYGLQERLLAILDPLPPLDTGHRPEE